MSTSYQEAGRELLSRVNAMVTGGNYTDLVEAKVTMKIMFARNPDAPSIMHNGWPAKALVRINNLRDRVAGLADVTILLDGENWEEWSEEHQRAILDHELFHILVCRNQAGAIRYDDANRPKLRLKPHDFVVAGFHEMARRHGEDSAEVMHLGEVLKVWNQGVFRFAAGEV